MLFYQTSSISYIQKIAHELQRDRFDMLFIDFLVTPLSVGYFMQKTDKKKVSMKKYCTVF